MWDKSPFIAPDEPSGPCDWLESCWLPSTDWRRDPVTKGFVPVCTQHSLDFDARAEVGALQARVRELEARISGGNLDDDDEPGLRWGDPATYEMERPSAAYNREDYNRLRNKFSRGDIAEDRWSALAARDFVWYCDNRVRPRLDALESESTGRATLEGKD